MASPGEKKGQWCGSFGHIMASFDIHDKCARCREKRIGDDPCVKDNPCQICDSFTEAQRDRLATSTYRIWFLVSPDEVTGITTVEDKPKDVEPCFQTPPPSSSASAVKADTSIFVTSEQLKQISDQWSEQFARFEALLSRGNVFSTPKTSVKPVPPHTIVSDSPFIAPSAGGCPSRGEVKRENKR